VEGISVEQSSEKGVFKENWDKLKKVSQTNSLIKMVFRIVSEQ